MDLKTEKATLPVELIRELHLALTALNNARAFVDPLRPGRVSSPCALDLAIQRATQSVCVALEGAVTVIHLVPGSKPADR